MEVRAALFEVYPEGVVYEIEGPVRRRLSEEEADVLGWMMKGLEAGGFFS